MSNPPPKATLSVVLIVKDEARNIEACLETVRWADEIVVLDSGSSDDTPARAARFPNAHIHSATDWQGYGIQRQRAQDHAVGDWVMMLDADERVTPELAAAIQDAVRRDNRTEAYALPRLSWCFGRFIRHGGWYPDYVTRLYPRAKGRYNDALVHEKPILDATLRVERLRGDLLHYTYDNLRHYSVKSAHYAEAWAEQRAQKGRSATLAQGALHALTCTLRMYVLRLGMLDGRQGLLLALLSGHSTFLKYAELWRRTHTSARPD